MWQHPRGAPHPCNRDALNVPTLPSRAQVCARVPLGRSLPPTQEGDCPFHCRRPFHPMSKRSTRAQLPKATEGFGGGWMLAFCSRPKPLVMKNLTPYLYLTLGRGGMGRTGFERPGQQMFLPAARPLLTRWRRPRRPLMAIFLLDLVVKRLMKTISRDNKKGRGRMHSFTLQQVQALTDQCE